MSKTYNIIKITTAHDYKMDCDLVFYRIDDGEGWTEYEVAIWNDDVSEYWTPATMSQTNHLLDIINGRVEQFDDIIREILAGTWCAVEQD